MKKLALFIALLFAFAFLLSYVKGQSELTESTSSLPTERRYHNWKMAWESSYDSQLNTSNQVPLIEQSLLQNSIEFRSIGPKKITWLKTNTAYSTNHRQQSNYFTGFEAGYSHKISRLEYTADLEVGYTRHFNFGRAGGEIAKTFRGEQLQIRPFARVDYYFPIDNFGDIRTNQIIRNGLAWSGGLETTLRTEPITLTNRTTLIIDSGSLLPGQRNLLNTEVRLGLNTGRFCFGPRIDFTHHISGIGWTNIKRNNFSGGFFVRYQ